MPVNVYCGAPDIPVLLCLLSASLHQVQRYILPPVTGLGYNFPLTMPGNFCSSAAGFSDSCCCYFSHCKVRNRYFYRLFVIQYRRPVIGYTNFKGKAASSGGSPGKRTRCCVDGSSSRRSNKREFFVCPASTSVAVAAKVVRYLLLQFYCRWNRGPAHHLLPQPLWSLQLASSLRILRLPRNKMNPVR